MTNGEKSYACEQSGVAQRVTPITGSTELQAAPTESHEKHAESGLNHAYRGFKRWRRIFFKDFRLRLYRARFGIEIIGLLGLLYYAYQAKISNTLTREIVRSTIAPAPSCAAQSSFSRPGSSNAPLVGAFYVNCGNAGKLPAKRVEGTVTIAAKSFPDERMLHTESWAFGGNDAEITPSEGGVWAFYSTAFDPDKELPLITAGREMVIGTVKFSYMNEAGETVNKESCRVQMNAIEVGSSPDGWVDCRMISAVKNARRAQKAH